MIHSSHIRKLVAVYCAGVLLFAQVAVAAHACAATMEAPGVAVAMHASHEAAPCDPMGVGQHNLCFRHCQDSQQTLDHHQLPSPGFVAALVYYIEPPYQLDMFSSALQSYSHALLARVTAPPLSVRNCCLRT